MPQLWTTDHVKYNTQSSDLISIWKELCEEPVPLLQICLSL